MKYIFILLLLVSTGCFASDYQPLIGATGEKIYSDACAACHGETGKGKFGIFFDLSTSTMASGQMKVLIQNGGSLMPAFPNIKGTELVALLEHVRSLSSLAAIK